MPTNHVPSKVFPKLIKTEAKLIFIFFFSDYLYRDHQGRQAKLRYKVNACNIRWIHSSVGCFASGPESLHCCELNVHHFLFDHYALAKGQT